MHFEQITKDRARVTGIANPEALKANLAGQGKFSQEYSKYTIETPLGNVEVKLDWGGSTLGVSIIQKPFFLASSVIFSRIKEEVEKAPTSA